MIETEFTIKEPDSSIGFKILIAFILTIYTSICYYFITTNEDTSKTTAYLVLLGVVVIKYMVPPGLITKSTHLNFTLKKIKYESGIGNFRFGTRWKQLENLNYISVFNTKNEYEVKLWFKDNQSISLFGYEHYDEVIEKAFFFSEKLDIDLLDARERGYHKWINKEVYRSTGKIKYLD